MLTEAAVSRPEPAAQGTANVSSVIGASADLAERGAGILFRVSNGETIYPAFVLRVDCNAIAYLNVCAHVGLRLNGDKNLFFNRDANLLLCQAHGAAYEPDTGLCVRGPCIGLSLIPLKVAERGGNIYLEDAEYKLIDD